MDDGAKREANEALVRRIMGHISAGELQEMIDLTHEDLVFELPYGGDLMPAPVNKQFFAAIQEPTFSQFSRFSIAPTEVHAMLDPDQLVVEYRSEGEVAATGKAYLNRYIGVFRFKDGKVVEWKEFHNPEVVSEAFARG
ncbi:MAG: nuclear transport factor 2 family protein [Actinobacteria bacterium]|nr:nuclear transport factor 2 family protein [Actinomycetota bacterium]MBV8958200.1 nuclear transport factor 2 family protein [Actinomycetota bacterium]MBV9662346.1 nuclear transport factor 2 family protein [Actinomycetota bacterium]MBV9934049.1 nuclear transport factor 2 family protein [Actinomycetota bacterium]